MFEEVLAQWSGSNFCDLHFTFSIRHTDTQERTRNHGKMQCNTKQRQGGVVTINGEEGTHRYSMSLDFCSWSAVASGAPFGSSEHLCPRTSVRISMF